jgi:hypothetical protein
MSLADRRANAQNPGWQLGLCDARWPDGGIRTAQGCTGRRAARIGARQSDRACTLLNAQPDRRPNHRRKRAVRRRSRSGGRAWEVPMSEERAVRRVQVRGGPTHGRGSRPPSNGDVKSVSPQIGFQRGYTLNRKCITSPSRTTYSLPSMASFPASRAFDSPPSLMKSSHQMTSALMNPFSKSVWMTPAA